MAKELLAAHPDYPMRFVCGSCSSEKVFDFIPTGRLWKTEHRVLSGGGASCRILDIAVLEPSGQYCGAVEICDTHPCEDEKLLELTDLVGNRWCELDAQTVVDCIADGLPIPIRTAPSIACDVCSRVEQRVRHRLRSRGLACVRLQQLLASNARAIQEVRTLKAELRQQQSERVRAERERCAARALQQMLQRSGEGDHILTFGKYAGVSLDVLVTEDRAYVEWLAGCDQRQRGGSKTGVMMVDLIHHARVLIGDVRDERDSSQDCVY
jgi:hypothetical protein